jgi:hypothetical protein
MGTPNHQDRRQFFSGGVPEEEKERAANPLEHQVKKRETDKQKETE